MKFSYISFRYKYPFSKIFKKVKFLYYIIEFNFKFETEKIEN